MAKPDDGGRVFEKKVGDQTLTRTVFNETDAVAAKFDGFHEKKTSSSGRQSGGSSSSGSSGGNSSSGSSSS